KREQVAYTADRRGSGRRPGVRQHEHVGTPRTPSCRIREVPDGGVPKDGILSGSTGVVHANGCEHVVRQEGVVGSAGYNLEYAPGDNHASVRVADVLAWLEERPALLSEPFDKRLQGMATRGIGKEQVRIDAVGVIQEIAHANLFGG